MCPYFRLLLIVQEFFPFRGTVTEDSSEETPDSYEDPSILEPKMGQLFKEDADAFSFYNLYARFNSFGIRMSKCQYLKGTNVKSMQEYCCTRQVCLVH
jgi:hypothetical protein